MKFGRRRGRSRPSRAVRSIVARSGDAVNRHVTHIHIEWDKTGVGLDKFASDLEDALYNEFSAGNISSGDYAVG